MWNNGVMRVTRGDSAMVRQGMWILTVLLRNTADYMCTSLRFYSHLLPVAWLKEISRDGVSTEQLRAELVSKL